MVQKGTYTEFLKSGVDFGSLLKKENEETEQSPVPGTPTLRNRTFSESSVWSQQSSRPSLKDGTPEGQDVSFSSCNTAWFCTLLVTSRSSVYTTRDIFVCPKVDSKFPRPYSMELVELKQNEGSKPGWDSPLGIRWRTVVGVPLYIPRCMWLTLILELLNLL